MQDCSKEYGRRVEGPNVSVKALTGAPFTIVNKVRRYTLSVLSFPVRIIFVLPFIQLGHDIILFIQPGGCLKVSVVVE